MSDTLHCPLCGAVLPADSGGGLCAQCLLRMALETETRTNTEPVDATAEEGAGGQFGLYITLRLLGKGNGRRVPRRTRPALPPPSGVESD
jgi:hypothetical protein